MPLYEKAFVSDSLFIQYPVDEDQLYSDNNLQRNFTPDYTNNNFTSSSTCTIQQIPITLKSPTNYHSPILLDFLDDDVFFSMTEKKQKSKTEFVRRDRQNSDESW